MSALEAIVADGAGLVSCGLWKVASVALLVLLAGVGGGTSAGWWLAARDRDQARAGLNMERAVSAGLRAGIREQNAAVSALSAAKEAADARGLLAKQLAAANGRRFDGALARIKDAKATTCADAMPAVNLLLEGQQ
ncbi:hypothetical protein AAKU55_005584 [Oxalobacteraceae bacterium GrIS 1.11]